MDWSKTKTRLIILLIILNIFLLGNYMLNNPSKISNAPSEETMTDLENRLNNVGISFSKDNIRETEKNIKPLIVKYTEETPGEINDIYFQGSGNVEVSDNITRITKGEEEITIINNRRFLYENFAENPQVSDKEGEEIALEFLESKNYTTNDMVLVKVENWDDLITYEYAKIYNDKILETSYTRITIENKVVTMVDRLWIEVIEEEARSIEIEPAYKALYSLLDREAIYGQEIKDMDICYYFNPEEQGLLEDNTRAERGRAIPAWRIVFENGSKVIVDNY